MVGTCDENSATRRHLELCTYFLIWQAYCPCRLCPVFHIRGLCGTARVIDDCCYETNDVSKNGSYARVVVSVLFGQCALISIKLCIQTKKELEQCSIIHYAL